MYYVLLLWSVNCTSPCLLVCLLLNFSCPLRISIRQYSSSDFRVNLLFLLMMHWKLQLAGNFLMVVVILVAGLEFDCEYFFTLGCCSLIFREQHKKLFILEMKLATTRQGRFCSKTCSKKWWEASYKEGTFSCRSHDNLWLDKEPRGNPAKAFQGRIKFCCLVSTFCDH